MNNYELNKVIDIHEKAIYLANGCIESNYARVGNGKYPSIRLTANSKSKTWRISRFLISLVDDKFNTSDPNQVVMHTCDNKKCINLDHLRVASQAENIADRDVKGRHPNSIKTHCIRNHELAGSNLILTTSGARNCRICKNASTKESLRKYRLKKREIKEQ